MHKSTYNKLLPVLFSTVAFVLSAAAVADPVPLGLPSSSAAHPESNAAALVRLGRTLFFDSRLSADGTISCSSCHDPKRAFSDNKRVAQGVHGHAGTRNAPSLLNVAFNTFQFWDGRRPTLESQVLDPLTNPEEHGLQGEHDLLGRLGRIETYRAQFAEAFPTFGTEIEVVQVQKALAAYERTLLSGNSPFDRYAYGNDQGALDSQEVRGLSLFKGAARCSNCHTIGNNAALFTDNAFHSVNVGFKKIAPRLAELTTQLVQERKVGMSLDKTVISREDVAELGRFAVTLDPRDIGKFRTPSLRNVALTFPYMHDGSVATLNEAVDLELYNRGAEIGIPLILTPQERADLIAFLKALNTPAAELERLAHQD